MKILLAKDNFMYYPFAHNRLGKSRFSFVLILFLSISFFPFHKVIAATTILDSSAEDYRIKGYEEQKKGNFPEAQTFYLKALSLGLKNAVIYNDVGVVYEQMEMVDKAEESYLIAIQTDPDYLPPYTNLAFLYKGKGDQARAIQYFSERLDRALDNDPWRERAKQELIDLDPRLQEKILQAEAQALNDKLALKAREDFLLQVERSERHFQKGSQFLAQKNFSEAITEFDRALALTPGNPKILEARGNAAYEQSMVDLMAKARAAVEKLEARQFETAREAFQKLLADIPDASTQNSGH